MATFKKLNFSGGSGDGRNIKVVATATPGTLIHTCSDVVTDQDEIYLYVANTGAASCIVTLEFGGVTNPDDRIEANVPSKQGFYTLVPGVALKGAASPLVVRIFAATTGVINVSGFVNRISE